MRSSIVDVARNGEKSPNLREKKPQFSLSSLFTFRRDLHSGQELLSLHCALLGFPAFSLWGALPQPPTSRPSPRPPSPLFWVEKYERESTDGFPAKRSGLTRGTPKKKRNQIGALSVPGRKEEERGPEEQVCACNGQAQRRSQQRVLE